ncbi:MAG TPA: M20/M25/M40 family metallo-hydrolase [Terriglobales bacterium]|nr:M20/M25/M40 family metallo-hydrolase [Terriglobales bacterium]
MNAVNTTADLAIAQQITKLASLRVVHAAFSWLQLQENELRKTQIEVASIPAPPFGEAARGAWLRQKFSSMGLEDVEIDQVGNVIATWPGSNSELPVVALSAHLDTVFPVETEISIQDDRDRIYGPGISDNAAGITALIAIAGALRQGGIRCASDVVFIGNVGEEGEGDLRGMRHIFQNSAWGNRIGYTVVLDGSGTDAIICQALGSLRFEVTVRGPGGHSWSDFGQPNPIVALARIVSRFSQTPLPAQPKTTFNFGVINGGTSVNSIPEMAHVSIDLRSVSSDELQRLEDELKGVIQTEIPTTGRAGAPPKLTCEVKKIGDRPAGELAPDAHILEIVRSVDAHLNIASQSRRASTDANIPIAMGLEALTLGAGGNGGGAHTLREWFDPAGRSLGLKRILFTVLALAGVQQS